MRWWEESHQLKQYCLIISLVRAVDIKIHQFLIKEKEEVHFEIPPEEKADPEIVLCLYVTATSTGSS